MKSTRSIKIDVLTLFPEGFSYLDTSIIKRATQHGIAQINLVNIRDFSKDPHGKCDDYIFGGGAGMLMTLQPVYDAIKSVKKRGCKIVMPSPCGRVFDHNIAKELAKHKHLVFVCGHYEGIDDRITELFDIEKISLGDFVLTGGELASMCMIDSLLRLVPGVINEQSLKEESFKNNLLEYPQYTRPATFKGKKVPDVLLSGDHQKIAKWREEQSRILTQKIRSDLIDKQKK